MDNAVEYAPSGGAVRIQSEAKQGRFTLRVINPADHLSTEDVTHLFDRFWRKDAARSRAEHAGLGLALAGAFAVSLGYQLNAALNGDACLAMTLEGPITLDRPRLLFSNSEKSKTKNKSIL